MSGSGKYWIHLAAMLIVAVWGATFVSSKILLDNGLSPTEIFIYRFFLAYVGMWFFSPRKLFSDSVRDELLMVVLGVAGGSVYFVFENTALQIGTLSSTVSLLVATAPIWTAILSKALYPRERVGAKLWVGTMLAMAGCAMVIFNGRFTLDLSNPAGYLLSLAAAMSWAVYSLVVRNLSDRYPSAFITRKVFFWGVVTAIPFMYIPVTGTGHFSFEVLVRPAAWGNLLFLGLVASLACYAIWNVVIKRIGVVRSSNYHYLNPAFTMVAAWLVLDERITWAAIGGFVLIVVGLWFAERGLDFRKKGVTLRK